MGGTMVARLRELSEAVGHGDLEVHGVVDQVYAHYQEAGEDLNHPRGGQAHALGETVLGGQGEWMEQLAARAITPDGSHLREAAVDVIGAWSARYGKLAPVEFDDLRGSMHEYVTDDGAVVHDKAPRVARLSEDELRRKHNFDHSHGDGPVPKNRLAEVARQRRVVRRENARQNRRAK